MSIRSFGGVAILFVVSGHLSHAADGPVTFTVVESSTATASIAPSAVQVNWINRYGQARRDSSATNRPMMLFLTMEGCVHCTRMDRDSFQDPNVAMSLNASFVPTRIKTNMQSRLARELKVNLFPTTIFIAPDGKILDYIRGYVPKHRLNSAMNHAMDASAASVASRTTP